MHATSVIKRLVGSNYLSLNILQVRYGNVKSEHIKPFHVWHKRAPDHELVALKLKHAEAANAHKPPKPPKSRKRRRAASTKQECLDSEDDGEAHPRTDYKQTKKMSAHEIEAMFQVAFKQAKATLRKALEPDTGEQSLTRAATTFTILRKQCDGYVDLHGIIQFPPAMRAIAHMRNLLLACKLHISESRRPSIEKNQTDNLLNDSELVSILVKNYLKQEPGSRNGILKAVIDKVIEQSTPFTPSGLLAEANRRGTPMESESPKRIKGKQHKKHYVLPTKSTRALAAAERAAIQESLTLASTAQDHCPSETKKTHPATTLCSTLSGRAVRLHSFGRFLF